MHSFCNEYHQFGKCLFISTDKACAVFSLEFGPRILAFSLCGYANIFYEQPLDADFLCTSDGWRVHAGTRLWLAPESLRTYFPDNSPVDYRIVGEKVVLTQSEDPWMGIRKTISAEFSDSDTLEIDYRIENRRELPINGSPWAVSSVRLGGVLNIPWTGSSGQSNPDRFISIWNATSLSDERLRFEHDCVSITPSERDEYFKIGLLCPSGEVSYSLPDQTFIKKFSSIGPFADNNVNLEVFCCRQMIEIETLGKQQTLQYGQSAIHHEQWQIRKTEKKE